MRLAIDLRPLLESMPSGVTQYTKAMTAEFLKRKDIEVDLFYQARKRCEPIHKLFPKVRHIQYSNSWFHFRSLLRFPLLPEDYFHKNPDLIWIPDRRPFYKTKIPIVMTIHDRVPELYGNTLSVKGRIWHLIFSFRRLKKICSGFLVPTFAIGETLRVKIPKEVTYEGAIISGVQTAPLNVKQIKKAPFFLIISPCDPRKRLDWFFAMAKRFPKINFVIIGLKSKESRFAKLALKKYSNVFVFSEVSEDEKSWFLHNAKALLALSKYEGFDLPVLEAVRAKCPVIMSGISVHHELYKTPECFVNNLQELEAAIYRSLNGFGKVPVPRGIYTWDKAAERALFFFLRVLANKNR